MKVLLKSDLDAAGCAAPNCAHDHRVLYFNPECHPGRGMDVRYDKVLSHLTVLCHACGRVVARIAPAESPGPGAACQ